MCYKIYLLINLLQIKTEALAEGFGFFITINICISSCLVLQHKMCAGFRELCGCLVHQDILRKVS